MKPDLDDLLAKHPTLSSGHLRLLSLDRISQEMGEKWRSRGDHIRFITESIIRRHLHRGQTFYAANDSTYVIVFDFDEESRAEHVCRAISREILQRLLGIDEHQAEELAIEMRVAQVSSDRLKRSGDMAMALERSLDQAPALRLTLPKEYGAPLVTTPVGKPATPGNAVPGTAHGHQGAGGQKGAPVNGAGDPSGNPGGDPGLGAGLLRQVSDRFVAVEQALLSVASALPETPDLGAVALRGFEFHYLPFWDPKSRAFLSCRLDPRLSIAGLGMVGTDVLADVVGDGELLRALDRLTVGQALLDLTRHAALGRKYSVIVPLHAVSLVNGRDRAHIIDLLERMGEPFPRLVNIELVDADKISWSDLVPYVWNFHGKCRRFILRQNLRVLPWFQTQHLPEDAMGVSTILPPPTMSERQIGEGMNAFVSAVGKFRFESYVYGVRTRSLAFAAIGAGFDHVSGPAIAPPAPDPIAAMRAELSQVFLADP